MANNIQEINKFMRDRKSITVASTISLALLSFYFLIDGFFKLNILAEVFAFDSYTLYRMEAVLIGLFLGVLAYSLYSQNQRLVNEALKRMKDKVAEEAKDIADKVEDVLDKDEDATKSATVEAKVPGTNTKVEAKTVAKKTKSTKKPQQGKKAK